MTNTVGTGRTRSIAASAYCAVTVVCGTTQRDVALPAGVPTGHLVPGLLRLLEPDDPPDTAHRWLLIPVGCETLGPTETLQGAGVLDGDLLMLQPRLEPDGRVPNGGSLRDHVEEIVGDQGDAWTAGTSAQFAAWIVIAVAAVLLLWPTTHGGGQLAAGVAATLAILLALVAVAVARRSAPAAIAALGVGCCWAGQAGWTWLAAFVGATGSPSPAGAAAAVGIGAVSACLLAAAAVAVFSGALVHVAVWATVGSAACVVAAVTSTGVGPTQAAAVGALTAVLVIGGAPRLMLAVGGLSSTLGVGDPALPARLARTDRLLTGLVLGLGLVAVLGATPAALSGDRWQQLLAGGVGLALLLRSRAFSRLPHVLGPRISGVVVLLGLWIGVCRAQGLPAAVLVLGATGTGALLAVGSIAAVGRTPVARARAGRFLDIVELGVVMASVVLAAGVLGLFAWTGSVLAAG